MEELARVERELQEQSARLSSRDEYDTWVQKCDECLELLEEHSRAKRLRLSIGIRQSLIARIAQLEGLKNTLRTRFVHAGAGHSTRDAGLVWREVDTAFDNRILTGIVINANHIEPRQFLEDAKTMVLERIRDAMERHVNVKVNTAFNSEFVAGEKRAVKSIATKNCELFSTSNLEEWYERRIVELTLASLEEFQERDSGWALSRILYLTINVNKYNPLHAGCHLELPRMIQLKRAVINVKSPDNACFAWAIVAALYPAERHADRASSYPHYTNVLNIQDIEFPMKINQITRFERLNDISINVYSIMGEKNESIVPVRLSDGKREKHVNLLRISDPRDRNTGHFAWIKDLSRLVSSQLSKKKARKYICDRCLHYFHSNEKLESHAVDCEKLNDCAILLPSEDNKWLSFSNHSRKERVPFVVYADLECTLEKTVSEKEEEGCTSHAYQHHKVFSIAYYLRCSYDDSVSYFRSRRDTDCISWFVEQLEKLAHRVKEKLSTNVDMETLSKEQWAAFHNATQCHVCEKPFATKDTRVRDHCHFTGRYSVPRTQTVI